MLRHCALLGLAAISCGAFPGSPTVRYYEATLTPAATTAASTSLYTLVIANCDANCVQATSHNQAFRSGEVTIPAGFVVASGTLNVSATGSKPWSASLSGTTIILGANGGNNGLSAGESLTLTFNATAPCASGAYAWTTGVYQDTLSQSGAVQPGTPYTLVGSQPSVEVTGSCSTQLLPGQYCSYSQGGWALRHTEITPARSSARTSCRSTRAG